MVDSIAPQPPTAANMRSLYKNDYAQVDGTETVSILLKSRSTNPELSDVTAKRIRVQHSDLQRLGDSVSLYSDIIKFEIFGTTFDADGDTYRLRNGDVVKDADNEQYTIQTASIVDNNVKTVVLSIKNKPAKIDP